MKKTYSYQILGISHTASKSEVKAAYRKLALIYHPDRNTAKEAHQKFLEINAAYTSIMKDDYDYQWYLEQLQRQYKRQSDADQLYKEKIREILNQKKQESKENNDKVAEDIKFYVLIVLVVLAIIYTVFNLLLKP